MSYFRRLALMFFGVLLVTLIAALAASSWFALKSFERELVPEIENKAVTLGRSVSGQIGRAISHGMALEQLVGVDPLFRDVVSANPEIGLVAITDNDGQVRHSSGSIDAGLQAFLQGKSYAPQSTPAAGAEAGARPQAQQISGHYLISLPIEVRGERHGFLHIGARAAFVQNVLQENLYDVLVVLVVAFFLAIEIVYFIASRSAASQLADLTQTLSGAAAGRFDRRLAGSTLIALGPLATAVNGALASVNDAHGRLVASARTLARGRHAHGAQAVRPAIAGLRALRARYSFGSATQDGGAATLGLLRAPLFLFLFAEDLTRPFIPAYAGELFAPVPGLSANFVVGLPVVLFMLIVALMQPVVGGWTERVGRRKALIVGTLIGAAAHVAAAFASSLYDLLLWRSLAGIAWGVMFLAGQGYVLDNTDAKSRTRGLAFFVGVIMVASVCGPSIGGILAEGIGYRGTLLVSAVLAALAGWMVWARLPVAGPATVAVQKPSSSDFAALLANRRFLVFLLTAAMPAKIMLIAYAYYLIPLYMPELGGSAAMAGRMIMLYAVVMVIGVPLSVRWSNTPSRRWKFVATGLLLSGLAGLMPLWLPGTPAVIVMVILLGLAQSLSIVPQAGMVTEVCRAEVSRLGEGAVFGVYRLIERIGNALGPLIAAALLAGLPFAQAFAAFGLLMLVAAAVFGWTFVPRPVVAPVQMAVQVRS